MTFQLPAHLQALNGPRVADRAAEGIGGQMPPHISFQSNAFALIDAAGNEKVVDTQFLDVCVLDVSDVMCKMFYGKEWEPGAKDPPACFSMNGVAPSKDAFQPQARTCAECPNNEVGSAVSKMSGAAIKACRDEKKLAVITAVPGTESMIFQFTLTPGSFVNWKAYSEKFRGQAFDMIHLWTRLAFERGKTGVITFEPRGENTWLDEGTVKTIKALQADKKTDLFVGRLDVPRGGELPASAAHCQISSSPENRQDPFANAPAADANRSTGAAATSATTAPTDEPGRRKRRTAAEMQAAALAKTSQPDASGPALAPFRPDPAPNGAGSPFGIGGATPVAENPELANSLKSVFG